MWRRISHFTLKYGPPGATDCAELNGYCPYRRVATMVPADELRAAVCVIGEDEAGNASAPYRQVLEPLG